MTNGVGPVLDAGDLGRAVAAAIRATNPGTDVIDRGSYLRVLVPGRCVLRRRISSADAGSPVRLRRG